MTTPILILGIVVIVFLVYKFVRASIAIIVGIILSSMLIGNGLIPQDIKSSVYNSISNFFGGHQGSSN